MRFKFLRNTIVFLLLSCVFTFNLVGQRKVEKLGRGIVAINKGGGLVYVSWRLLASDPEDIAFNLYRSIGGGAGVKINTDPIIATTDFTDNSASTTQTNGYYVRPIINSTEQDPSGTFTLPAGSVAKSYNSMPLQPLSGYSVNHVYVGDLNGDREYDYIVKRVPEDLTNNVIFEAYLNDGTYLWRINLGPNIEQGNSTYNPITLVHDFDCDGKAEIMIRSGEGTIFANGYTIPDMNSDGITDYRTFPAIPPLSYMLLGDNCPEFISMVNGMTGEEITRTDYIDRGPKANWMALWGDTYGHRMNMNFCGVAYLDGIHPSIVVSRGDGGIMDIEAFDYKSNAFTSRWTWSARTNAALPSGKTWRQFHDSWVSSGAQITGIPAGYHWADFHNIRVVDLDGDGKDEISWGVNAMDDNGTPLYFAKNDIGHGDRFVITDIDPDRPGLECYAIQQSASVLAVYYDAKTGERIKTWSSASPYDVGRGDAADIDPRYKGVELWSYAHAGLLNCKGTQIAPSFPHPALSIWWDNDLRRENLDASGKEGFNPIINKWDYTGNSESRLISLYNEGGAYTTISPYAGRVPLYADIMGDWREEIVLENSGHTELRFFSTSAPASRRLYCLMQNPEYRMCINLKAYLPSTEVDYYLGEGMSEPPLPPVLEMKRQWKGGNGNIWDINTTSNWITNDSPSMYSDGDSVMFDITGTGNTSVELSGSINPGYVIVNSPVDYTFMGTGSLDGTTRLIKSGKGALTIKAHASYSGTTKVDEGTLYVDTTLTNSPVWVNRNATLGGKGIISQQVTLVKGATIVPGTIAGVDSLTFSGSLTLPGYNTCIFDITDDSTGLTKPSDKIIINGDLTISDTNFLKINKVDTKVKPGNYPLIVYSGTFTGNLKKIGITGLFGQKYTLKDSINKIWLVVMASRPAGKVVWNGTGEDWDLLTSPNWLYKGISDIFATGDSVVFDETGSGQYEVNLVGDLPISNMVVETESNNYAFSGTGNIGGTGGITKNGQGVMSMLGSNNSYSGKTIINNGVFEFTSIANAGLNSSLGTAPVASSNIVFNNAKVRYISAADATTDRGLTITGTQDTIEVTSSGKVLAFGGVVTGSGKLVKTGAGTLYFQGNTNNYSGGTVIKAGVLQVNDPLATVGALGSGSLTIEGGTFTMGNNTGTPVTVFNNNIIVPEGSVGTLNTDGRCEYNGSLTGSGVLNIYVTYVRSIFNGNWSGYTGTINITADADGGQFRMYNSSGYPNAKFNLASGVTLLYNYANQNSNGAQTVNIGALSGAAGSYLAEENWVVGAKNTSETFSGTISGNSLTKVGTGSLTLSSANTYTGGTTINGGTLTVWNTTGSATGTGTVIVNNTGTLEGKLNSSIAGAVVVNSGGTLTGISSINGALTINNGANLAPGSMFGTITVNNNVTLQAGSKLALDVISESGYSDRLNVTGTNKLKLDGALYVTNQSTTPLADGNSFTIFSCSNISGTFDSIVPAVPGPGLVWDTTMLTSGGIIRVDDPTGVRKITYSTEIKVYPNPTKGKFVIECNELKGGAVISIESMGGLKLYSNNYNAISKTIEIDLTQYPKGVYIIRVTSGNNYYVKKVIRE